MRNTCSICQRSYSGDHCPNCGWFVTDSLPWPDDAETPTRSNTCMICEMPHRGAHCPACVRYTAIDTSRLDKVVYVDPDLLADYIPGETADEALARWDAAADIFQDLNLEFGGTDVDSFDEFDLFIDVGLLGGTPDQGKSMAIDLATVATVLEVAA